MTRPLVSVVLPVRDGATTVAAAVRSVLGQTLGDLELLLIDDGSIDGSAQVARAVSDGDARLRVLEDGDRRGLVDRLNQGVALARGKYVARMDADDICFPERLATQAQLLDARPDLQLVGSAMAVFDGGGKLKGVRRVPVSHDAICRHPYSGFPVPHPTWLGHASWFRQHPYDRRATRCEDQELLLRTYRASRFGNVDTLLLGYREARLNLRSIETGRRHFAAACWRDARAQQVSRLVPSAAAIVQLAKAVVDGVAVVTRTESRLLRHRARAPDSTLESRWDDIYRDVTQ